MRKPRLSGRPLFALALLAAVTAITAAAQGALPQPIYFFGDPINTITPQNPLVIRPAGFPMFEDGSWDLQALRWTGWGSTVARASGISSASNDIPNAAQGRRTNVAAQVALSNPGPFEGHEVYRCFQLTIPSHPASDQHLCLKRVGSVWGLAAVKSAAAPASAEFVVRTVGASCEMHDSASAGALVRCQSFVPQRTVQMGPDGALTICRGATATTNTCDLGNPGIGTPQLAAGKQITVGRFRCRSAQAGLTCIVTASGKGFLMNNSGITPVGGATVASAWHRPLAFTRG